MMETNTLLKEKKPSKAKYRTKRNAASRASSSAAPNLNNLDSAVRQLLADSIPLPDFLATAGPLSKIKRKIIVEQALIFIGQNYAHLPLKRAMHSIDPIQRLKLLDQSLDLTASDDLPSAVEFNHEMTDIFTSLRDLHTNYLLPAPFNQYTAYLPFFVDDCYENDDRIYVVSGIVKGFDHPTFVPGVEVVYWNGMPIEQAVLNNSQRYAGSNREARHARGVQTLTKRALIIAPPPDEEWVIVTYRTSTGELLEERFEWLVSTNPPPLKVDGDAAAWLPALGVDLEQEIVREMRLALFAPQVIEESRAAAKKVARGEEFGPLEPKYPSILTPSVVETPSGTFGYLRIWKFNFNPSLFISEFMRLITTLPQDGLIIDVRGNGGGVIWNSEYILQMLTPRWIEPEPTQFINTPLNLEICRKNGPDSEWTDLSPWVESMQQALPTGSIFSAGFPISDPAISNIFGQKYFGPVVLITDALCYSATDIFAAGFQDHDIGPILGADGNTGAGGANVWEHQYFVYDILPNSVYRALPDGAGMRVSIRRTLRVGTRAGAPVEDLGVVPNHRHFMTRADVLHKNVDLINAAAALLEPLPKRSLKVTLNPTSATQLAITVTTVRIDRLDLYVDGRPIESVDIQGEQTTFDVVKRTSEVAALELRGFEGGELVARYRQDI